MYSPSFSFPVEEIQENITPKGINEAVEFFVHNEINLSQSKHQKKGKYAYLDTVFTAVKAKDAMVSEEDLLLLSEGDKKLKIGEREIVSLDKWYRIREQKYAYYSGEPVSPEKIPLQTKITMIDGRRVVTWDAVCKRVYRFVDGQQLLTMAEKTLIKEVDQKTYVLGKEVYWDRVPLGRKRKLKENPRQKKESSNCLFFNNTDVELKEENLTPAPEPLALLNKRKKISQASSPQGFFYNCDYFQESNSLVEGIGRDEEALFNEFSSPN